MSESNEIETCREMTPEEAALRPMESPAAAAETPPPQVPLPRFRSHKVVEAAKVVHVEESALILDPGDGRDQFVHPVTPEWIARHAPGPGRTSLVPGYFVRYADGYESWSPAAAFEAGYCAEVPEPATESAPDDLRIALKEANLVPPADLRLMPRRLLHGHQVNDCNGRLMIGAMDDPGPGGACHHRPGGRDTMNETNLVPAAPASPNPLRAAAAEALLSGALVLADVRRDPNWAAERITKESEERFRKALEALAGALG